MNLLELGEREIPGFGGEIKPLTANHPAPACGAGKFERQGHAANFRKPELDRAPVQHPERKRNQ